MNRQYSASLWKESYFMLRTINKQFRYKVVVLAADAHDDEVIAREGQKCYMGTRVNVYKHKYISLLEENIFV